MANVFYVMATKFAGQQAPAINKISFDKKSFKQIPANFQNSIHHPLITKQSAYKSFLNAIAAAEKPVEKQCFRNIKLEMFKNGARTDEAKTYLDEQDKFVFKGLVLADEIEQQLVTLADSTGNYSASYLMEVFESFDHEDGEDTDLFKKTPLKEIGRSDACDYPVQQNNGETPAGDLTVNQTKLKEKPIVSYFEQKLLVHSKVLPSMCRESTIVRTIFQLGDDKLIKVFYPMRSDKLETILNRAEFEDSLES